MTSFIHLDYRKLKMLLKQEVTSKMLETMGDSTFETAILFSLFSYTIRAFSCYVIAAMLDEL